MSEIDRPAGSATPRYTEGVSAQRDWLRARIAELEADLASANEQADKATARNVELHAIDRDHLTKIAELEASLEAEPVAVVGKAVLDYVIETGDCVWITLYSPKVLHDSGTWIDLYAAPTAPTLAVDPSVHRRVVEALTALRSALDEHAEFYADDVYDNLIATTEAALALAGEADAS